MDSRDLAEYLKERGHKITQARLHVLGEIAKAESIFSPADIYESAREQNSSVGLTTVYRTLDILSGMGLIKKVHLEDGCNKYLAVSRNHTHQLICSGCGAVVEVPECTISGLAALIAERTNFEIDGHWLEFFGRCVSCRSPQDN